MKITLKIKDKMQNKNHNKNNNSQVSHRVLTYMRRVFLANKQKTLAIVGIFTLLFFIVHPLLIANKAEAAGIDTITTTLVTSTAVSTESQITVVFSPITAVIVTDTVSVYIGETSAGDPWVDTDGTVDSTDITCAGTGYTFGSYVQADATASTPSMASCDVTGLADGTNEITITIGTNGTDSLYNPAGADIYTVSVVTNDDSGAGVTYVADANKVTVSATVLPTLAMLLDNPTGGCSGTPVVTCDLGVQPTAAVSVGTYDVNAGSNSTGNITIQIAEDGDLGTIDDVVNDTTVAGDGIEEYGVAISGTAAEWTMQGNYVANDTPIVTGPTNFAVSDGPASEAGEDITVEHRSSISTSTAEGSHSHVVTYTVAADF